MHTCTSPQENLKLRKKFLILLGNVENVKIVSCNSSTKPHTGDSIFSNKNTENFMDCQNTTEQFNKKNYAIFQKKLRLLQVNG